MARRSNGEGSIYQRGDGMWCAAATLVDPPKAQRYSARVLSPEEAALFLDAIKGDRLEALYVLTLALGLRQGEVLGLRWQPDLDLQRATITVNVALQYPGGQYRLVEPKTDRARRTLSVPPRTLELLRGHRKRQLEERLKAGDAWQEWGLVFTTQIGTPLDGRNVYHYLHRHLERARLPRLRFHDLRHSCASPLLAQGWDLRVIMETLGHSQIFLTANTYTHVMPALRREVADTMDRLLRGAMRWCSPRCYMRCYRNTESHVLPWTGLSFCHMGLGFSW